MSEKKILIDSNLLLLFVVGKTDVNLISKHRRLQELDVVHYKVLCKVVRKYKKIVVTPHILAEFWNLMGEDKGNWDVFYRKILKTALSTIKNFCEIYNPAKELIEHNTDTIGKLGISDVSLLVTAKEKDCSLVTRDKDLRNEAMKRKIKTYHSWQMWDKF